MSESYVDAPFATVLLELAASRPDLVVLSADLSKYTDVLPFAEKYPDRFFQVGMAEQNMMGMAGGLAKTGYLPIAVTYGVFATRRAYEQVAMAMASGPSRGIVVAFLPGITTPFAATHQAIDDLAIMQALPGMTVIDPADAAELAGALRAAVAADGPVYIRGQRGRVPQILAPQEFRIGPARQLRSGGGVGVIGTGIGTQWILQASTVLTAAGIDHGLLHVPTLKPLNRQEIQSFCAGRQAVVTVENHSIIGGLASTIADVLAGSGSASRLHPLGVPDRWAPAGSVEHIRAELGLDTASITQVVKELS